MPPPVIVLGVGRSGTTLLRVMLDRHSTLAIPYESFFVTPLAHRHGRRPKIDDFLDDLGRFYQLYEWGIAPDDVQARRDSLKPYLALYVGGMGAKGRNFYNSLVRRYGWEEEAERIQELYLGGKQREAIAAVPDELVDAVSLIGPKERIAERLDAWRETPVTTLVLGTTQPEALQTLAELVL